VLWRSSWQAAVLAAIVLGVQWVARDRLSARWRYNLWLLVLLRLIVPVTPPSPVSVFNLANHLAPPTPQVLAPASKGDLSGSRWSSSRRRPTRPRRRRRRKRG
jgi:bla regulator protein BlaR1